MIISFLIPDMADMPIKPQALDISQFHLCGDRLHQIDWHHHTGTQDAQHSEFTLLTRIDLIPVSHAQRALDHRLQLSIQMYGQIKVDFDK